MKIYPKVPRYDHPVVPEDFWDQDLVAVEKFDGSNFRWTVYEDRYDYHPLVEEHNPEHGDVVFGTRKSILGTIDDDLNSLPGNVRRAVRQLRDHFDPGFMMGDEFNAGPVVMFAENMVRHTLDYGYNENPPPALIGFDVYIEGHDHRDELPSHPYEEKFLGYADYDGVKEIFDLAFDDETDVTIPSIIEIGATPDNTEIPFSEYGPVKAEGVVFRGKRRRVKMVRDEFKELNKEMFGADFVGKIQEFLDPDDPESHTVKTAEVIDASGEAGASYIADKFATSGRIRKHVQKMLDEGEEFGMHLMSSLPDRVEDDIWTEEMHEIRQLDMNLNPSKVSATISERCRNELVKMEQNAKLSDSEPQELWNL